jgi:hypothetical protein
MHCSLGSLLLYGSFWRGSYHHRHVRRPSYGESTTPRRWLMSGRKAASEEGISSRRPSRSSFLLTSVICGRRLEVPVHPRLAPRSQSFSPDFISQGFSSDRPLRFSPFGPDEAILCLDRCGQTGCDRRPQPKVGLQPSIPFPSHFPPQEGDQEVGVVQKDVSSSHPVLGRLSKRLSKTPLQRGLPLQALAVDDVRRLLMSANIVIDLTTGEPPPNLDRVFLVVWTISGGVGASIPSRIGHSISSRQDGSDPQKSAMSARGSPSRTSFALSPFRSIRLL